MSDFREACQKLWKSQASTLSIQWKDLQPPGTEEEDEDEDLSDEDDFDDEFSDFDEDVAAKGSTTPSSSGGKGRKKEEEDTKELKSIQTGEFFDSLTTNTILPGAPVNPPLQPSEFLVSQTGPQWEPPKQVVKRITRKIKPDGSETIEVRFIVSDVEVSRVQGKKEGATKRKSTVQALTREFEDLFEDERSEANALKLNIGKMKNKVDSSSLCSNLQALTCSFFFRLKSMLVRKLR